MTDFSSIPVLLNGLVQKDPNFLINFVANFLGAILNFFYNFVSAFTTEHALGISIILLTIFSRLLMVPLAIKSQKSMAKMQQLNPQIEKINKKYGNTKDPELMQKKNQEIQALYAKENVNPLSGCLPLFIQMPIFFALTYIMNQSYLYIDKIKVLYVDKIATTITNTYIDASNTGLLGIIKPLVNSKLPKNNSITLNIANPVDLAKAINKFTSVDWQEFLGKIPAQFSSQLNALTEFGLEKKAIDTFFGLNVTNTPSFAQVATLAIPVLAALTTFLSSYLINKQQKNNSSGSSNEMAESMQKSMTYVMPLMMGFFTFSTPIGVGLYWITSNIIQVIQQYILNKVYSSKKKETEKNVID